MWAIIRIIMRLVGKGYVYLPYRQLGLAVTTQFSPTQTDYESILKRFRSTPCNVHCKLFNKHNPL